MPTYLGMTPAKGRPILRSAGGARIGALTSLLSAHVEGGFNAAAPAERGSAMTQMTTFLADARYAEDGGWKVHLTIGPELYEERSAKVGRWMEAKFAGQPSYVWKNREGGDEHEKDFTIYLGSYATMMAFVEELERSKIIEQLDASNVPSHDRVVGKTGKCSARFDPRGKLAGRDWFYGSNGVPFTKEDVMKRLRHVPDAEIVKPRKAALLAQFGDYFLPAGTE